MSVLSRTPAAHTPPGRLVRKMQSEHDTEIATLKAEHAADRQEWREQMALLTRRVRDLEQREASREPALQRTFRKHRERLDKLDGGITPGPANPLAETLPASPAAADALAKRYADAAAGSLTDRLGPGSGRHLADKPPPAWAAREPVTWQSDGADNDSGDDPKTVPLAAVGTGEVA